MAILMSQNGTMIGGNGAIKNLGNFTESDLVSGAITIPIGNSTTKLTLTTVSTLTVNANVDTPNFALEIDNTNNSSDVTVTVKSHDGLTSLMNSVSAGNKVNKNSYVQLTCVGNCWTLAEFGTANA